ARHGDDLTDHAVTAVGDEEVARAVEGDARGEVERGRRRQATVAREATGASGSHHRADLARRRSNLADDAVIFVGDDEVARTVEGEGHGEVELGLRGRTAVAAEITGASGSRHR